MILTSIIPSHVIANWLLDNIDKMLEHLGMRHNSIAEQTVYFIAILGASVLIGWLLRKVILFLSRRIVKLRHTAFAADLIKQSVLTHCSHMIPPLVFLALIPFAFDNNSPMLSIIMHLGVSYLIVSIAIAANAVIKFAFIRYNARENTKNLPWRGTLNIARGLVWILAAICVVSVLAEKSPAVLLTGLGAFAAALMLIFKDSILGFVAGIQMSQNDMVRVGDWVVVHDTNANGIVISVTLTTVKVQNWDNTITMVPPYTLVSTSFTNYRGMYDSGVRRIAVSLLIDISTVHNLGDAELAQIETAVPEIAGYVKGMQDKGVTSIDDGGNLPRNGTIQTNLGLFRAWAGLYLMGDPDISNTNIIMVRMLESTPYGIPMQLYCFTSTTDWAKHQSIQSRVMERITATAPLFGVRIYARNDLAVSDVAPASAPVS